MSFFAEVAHFFASNGKLLLDEAKGHVVLSVVSVGVAIGIGLPIGVLVGHLHRWSFVAINGGNVLRALPTLAIIAVGIGIYGLGFVNILVALVILALPLILTNAYVAVDGIDRDMVEAARGMGLTGWQIVWRVELPNALPLIMAGIRTSWVYVVATAYLASLAGYTGTLGDVIANITGYGLSGVVGAAIVSIVIAFLGDFVLAGVERWLTPRGVKLAARTAVA